MPHPDPAPGSATTEIPAPSKSMFGKFMLGVSRGLALATGTTPVARAPIEIEINQAIPMDEPTHEFDPCFLPTLAALQKCVDHERSDCEQAAEDLIRCLNRPRPLPGDSGYRQPEESLVLGLS